MFRSRKQSRYGNLGRTRGAGMAVALERIGGQFEGILRAHRMAADYIARESVRYSILMAEWPAVKQRLVDLMHRG
jgi:hypothetical protein